MCAFDRRRAPAFLGLWLAACLGSAPGMAATPEQPITELPYSPSLDPSSMDPGVDPCVDLYHYACGGWIRKNPIPPDRADWSVYAKLEEDNERLLWGLLQSAAEPAPDRAPALQRVGDYFAACMDQHGIQEAGMTPLMRDLAAIQDLGSVAELARLLGRLHLQNAGNGFLFGFGSNQDFGDSTRVIAFATAGGLSLPDRDYYIQDDARFADNRKEFAAHVTRMFRLLGDGPDAAAAHAATVLRLETALARASLSRVDQRDPYKLYHVLKARALRSLTPAFRWDDYFTAAGLAKPKRINVTEPDFLKEVDRLLQSEPLADWKTYLRWHVASARAPYLTEAFEREDFDFFSRYLQGVQEMPPRWKRCVELVDRDLGEALGQVYVEKAFAPRTRAAALDMVHRIHAAMDARIRGLDWMAEATKERALEKLHAMSDKIGYPDRFRDYGPVRVVRDDFAGNVARATEFESRRQLAKIGRPVDHGEWSMTPPTVNAYYNPFLNDMNFPAGVLQPPLFDPKTDAAPNYGNTGGTIGHELTHGFDDEGRQFDAQGNLRDWWTEKDAKEFESRAACIVEQYGRYIVVDDIHLNSKLTLGEDVADLGGTILAWLAWKDAVRGQSLAPVDGLTPEQRFFVGYAQWDCSDERDASKRLRATTNEHSPGIYRINGVVANMPEFAAAFACKPGQPMVNPAPCRIW
jgi:endothelin-converting enzyme/putative endopeptidase